MNEAIIVFIVFASMTTVAILVGLIVYFGKRLEHKQILAAIEKGTPLSELKPPKKQQNGSLWIRNLTFGIALLIIGLALIVVGPRTIGGPGSFIAFVFFGVGIAWLIRGLLYRKYQLQSQSSDKRDTAENRNAPGVSTTEAVQ
jgi:sterol desaturase/sphingolipid hydroxylase (fatty acid hydroxylase superfamily)